MRLLFLALALAASAFSADLLNVRNVYILPMQAGLDQYMANRLTEKKLWVVVTDPNQADAVLTDRIGEGFQEQFAEIYPEAAPKPKDDEKDQADAWISQRPRSASFGRGRGTIFVVDRKTRDVVWSVYSPSSSMRPKDLDRNATAIVRKIESVVRPKASK